jgi:hypothetical protein
MMRDNVWTYAVPVGRSIAGFISALLLAFFGDIGARVFNLAIGYPWSQDIHQNINFVGIGVGAGIGAYLGWINPGQNRYLQVGTFLLVIASGVLGSYLGRAYGPGVDPTYWWSRFATDRMVYLGAAVSAIIIATAAGLISQIRLSSLIRSRSQPRTGPHLQR